MNKKIYFEKLVSSKKQEGYFQIQVKPYGLKLPQTLMLFFYKDNIFRLKMSVGKEDNLLKDLLVNEGSLEKNIIRNIKVKNQKQKIIISSNNLKMIIDKMPFNISILDKNGKILFQQSIDKTELDFVVLPFGYTIYDKNNIKVRETIKLSPDEHIYGLGEKFMSLDKTGRKLQSWTMDTFGLNTTDFSYKNIPFFISTKGYGIFINSSNKIIYDFGHTSSISYSFEIESSELDYFFIYGPDFKNIIYKYTELTGKPIDVSPKWSFGIWMSRCMYKTKKQVVEIVKKMKRYKVPFDVIHLDPLWLKKRKKLNVDCSCELEWDQKAFPKPQEFIEKLHRLGIKLSLWINPYIHKETEIYKEGIKNKFFPAKKEINKNYEPANIEIPSESPIPLTDPRIKEWVNRVKKLTLIDFTNPKAVEWYQKKFLKLLDMGVDVFKTDYGEWAPVHSKYYNGMNGNQMHNLYPLLYNKAIFEITKKNKGRGIVWARAGYAGIQRYPVGWSGDAQCNFDALAQVIKAGLNYGLSGVSFWSNDLGGFIGKPSVELYIRWLEFGLFCSNARFHGCSPREPWEFGKKALKTFRFYAKLRYRLLPYLYSYAYVAKKTGLPIIRALVLEYQNDPNVYNIDLEYLFGKELLIAPVYNQTNQRDIYLPEGKWIDFWTKKENFGPANIKYYAELEKLPIFIKNDSIIIYGQDRYFIDNKPEKKLTLDIYLDKMAEFIYYDDFETIKFSGIREKNKILFNITDAKYEKEYIMNFNKIDNIKKVKIDDKNYTDYKFIKNKLILKIVTLKKSFIEIDFYSI